VEIVSRNMEMEFGPIYLLKKKGGGKKRHVEYPDLSRPCENFFLGRYTYG